tara:strand:- start:236 stop:478 length:243 start_codon:yes stop_codon:yes gene_type:complete
MSSLYKAYRAGKALALYKFAKDIESEKQLTSILKQLVSSEKGIDDSIKDSSVLSSEERNSKATWGDKINLEPSSATGIQV